LKIIKEEKAGKLAECLIQNEKRVFSNYDGVRNGLAFNFGLQNINLLRCH